MCSIEINRILIGYRSRSFACLTSRRTCYTLAFIRGISRQRSCPRRVTSEISLTSYGNKMQVTLLINNKNVPWQVTRKRICISIRGQNITVVFTCNYYVYCMNIKSKSLICSAERIKNRVSPRARRSVYIPRNFTSFFRLGAFRQIVILRVVVSFRKLVDSDK